MAQLITPSSGYGNVSDLRSLHKEREIKKQDQQKHSHAMAIVDRIEHKIEDVASLSQSKHNRSLKPEQVVLDGYRSGLKFAAGTAGNVFMNLVSLFQLGGEVPQGLDAVLNRGADGKAESFEAQEKSRGKDYNYETDYSKQLQQDGSTLYRLSEEELPKNEPGTPLHRSTTVKIESNGTLFIEETCVGLELRD